MNGLDTLEKILIPLVATFSGAYLAFRYQRSIELKRDKRAVVQNLMMYRNVAADEILFINSLNVVDIVFHNNERVRQLYHQFLEMTKIENFSSGKHVEVFYEMLYEMTQRCGYTQITKDDVMKFYSPNALDLHYPKNYDAMKNWQPPPENPPYRNLNSNSGLDSVA
jgi:hypothetical protein